MNPDKQFIRLYIVFFAQTCSKSGILFGCNSDDDITSFRSIDAVFEAEAATATRYMLTGRRYMQWSREAY